ncbi:hypothetical protein SUGI_1034430 [Cryptomeria japonica]|nr:hypothetical protein SUGI_1034430 [Cryptomeria japonica]
MRTLSCKPHSVHYVNVPKCRKRNMHLVNYFYSMSDEFIWKPLFLRMVGIGKRTYWLTNALLYWKVVLLFLEAFDAAYGYSNHNPTTEEQAVPLGTDDETLVSGQEESCTIATICFNIRWTGFTMLMLIWILFTALQIIKNNTVVCGLEYWILSVLQVLVMDRLNIISSK